MTKVDPCCGTSARTTLDVDVIARMQLPVAGGGNLMVRIDNERSRKKDWSRGSQVQRVLRVWRQSRSSSASMQTRTPAHNQSIRPISGGPGGRIGGECEKDGRRPGEGCIKRTVCGIRGMEEQNMGEKRKVEESDRN